jgi:phenazine biosynthesis protein phzE
MTAGSTWTAAVGCGDPVLSQVLAPQPPPFALLHRPEWTGPDHLDLVIGTVHPADSIAAIPVPPRPPGAGEHRHQLLVVIPYRQVAERGFACRDDGAPLLIMSVRAQATVSRTQALAELPAGTATVAGGHFDVDDATYAAVVRRVVTDEIGRGEGANFVIKRSFVADITDYSPAAALSFFRQLLAGECGAYWTFIIHTGTRTFVGASPERHVSLAAGTAVMNPISGTYRYPPAGPTLAGLLRFLADGKEANELYMVVDEELKMMARVCQDGGRVVGPYLKEMTRLAHTEYLIEGTSAADIRDILRGTLLAPTVTGSPVESACRVIRRYERAGRGYYSGVAALIGHGPTGEPALDSAILIRTADIDAAGRMRIGVGATLVRDSDPDSEVAETRAKAAGLLAAVNSGPGAGGDGAPTPPGGARRLAGHPRVRRALAARNATIARFWLAPAAARARPAPHLAGRRVLVVDAEDTFTAMLDHQLRALGLVVTVRRFDEPYRLEGWDVVVMGPGPGDPRELADPKIAHLRAAVAALLRGRRPFLAVCLSHQVLCTLLGLPLIRRQVPNQGVQREIDLFGRRVRVGFYNTFAARHAHDVLAVDGVPGVIEMSRDPVTGEVHALRGSGLCAVQFHAESLLTEDGLGIIAELMTALVPAPARADRAGEG